MFDFSSNFWNETKHWHTLQQNHFLLLICAVVPLREHHWNLLIVNLRLLKALLNRSNVSSDIKMPCWMKCWNGFTEHKNSNIEIWRWMKIYRKQIFYPTFSGSSNTFFMLDRFTPCFMQHFILMTSFRILELRISNDSIKLKRSAK